MQTTDVLIIGGGPAGLCCARALAGSGLGVVVVERQPRALLAAPAFDGREIALTHASRQILQALGIWQRIEPADISTLRHARVTNGASPFALNFSATEAHAQELGWLVPNHLVRQAAWHSLAGQSQLQVIDQAQVRSLRPQSTHSVVTLDDGRELSAKLVVAADSRFSSSRRQMGIGAQTRDFGKSMLVCRMRQTLPHRHVAWEWFGYERTLALLPLNGDSASVVITLPPAQIEALRDLDESAFAATVSGFFEHRFGAMTPISGRHVYPLVGVYADRFVAERYALIGDAAVGMHPVTAHGFNLGLQSQWRLASALSEAAAAGGDIGAPALLAGYQQGHRRLARPLYEATNLVASLYNDSRLPARWLRAAGLRIAQRVGPFRRLISAHLTQREAMT